MVVHINIEPVTQSVSTVLWLLFNQQLLAKGSNVILRLFRYILTNVANVTLKYFGIFSAIYFWKKQNQVNCSVCFELWTSVNRSKVPDFYVVPYFFFVLVNALLLCDMFFVFIDQQRITEKKRTQKPLNFHHIMIGVVEKFISHLNIYYYSPNSEKLKRMERAEIQIRLKLIKIKCLACFLYSANICLFENVTSNYTQWLMVI